MLSGLTRAPWHSPALPLSPLSHKPILFFLLNKNIKINVPSYRISSPQSFANDPPRRRRFISGIFLLVLSPSHLFCCRLLLFQTHSFFCAVVRISGRLLIKTGSWQPGDKYYFLNLPSFVSHLQPQPGTRWKQLIKFGPAWQEFFLVFLSPWVCAAFSGNS